MPKDVIGLLPQARYNKLLVSISLINNDDKEGSLNQS